MPIVSKTALVAGMAVIAFVSLAGFAHADVATSTPSVGTSTASISGKAYQDINRNEKLDAGEPGIAGFTINLYHSTTSNYRNKIKVPFMSTTTDINGNYSFVNLVGGIYKVKEIRKAGWRQTSSDYRKLVIENGSSVSNIDFANASSTKNKNHDNDDDDDDNNDHQKGRGSDKGKHLGWLNFFERFAGFPWGQR